MANDATKNRIPNSSADNGPDSLLPIWLNNEFLQSKFQQYFNDTELKVIDFRSAAGSGGFVSSILRLTVNLNKAPGNHLKPELSVIAKLVSDENEFAYNTYSSLNIYAKEIEFYDQIAPKMKKYLKQLNETASLLPKTYGVCTKNNVILFEDLNTRNYVMKPIRKPYSVDEVKLVLKKLAAFHAICSKLQQNEENIFKNFQDGIISQTIDGFNNHLLNQYDVVIEVISTWPDFVCYEDKLRRMRGNLVRKMREVFVPNREHFNTLNHGDFWRNNVMMKYSDEAKSIAENAIFIDFQFPSWGSSAIDLYFFFSSSVHDSLKPHRFNEFIEFYHENLSRDLKNLNYSHHIPTAAEFKAQLNDKILWGFITTCLIQPVHVFEFTEPIDFGLFISGNEEAMTLKRKMFSSPKIQAILRKFIPYYDQLGVFNLSATL